MNLRLLATSLAGATLLLTLAAFQGKSKLALDRPFVNIQVDATTFTKDMQDIKNEHSLPELQRKHLVFYRDIAVSQGERFRYPLTGITYRQASQLLEQHEYSKEGQERRRRIAERYDAPPLLLKQQELPRCCRAGAPLPLAPAATKTKAGRTHSGRKGWQSGAKCGLA